MARDHRKLRVFQNAHRLTLAIYRHTRHFPKDEWFGLRAQLRRAAASVPSNVVEGSARRSIKEYCSFLNIARASAGELRYLIGLATELELLSTSAHSNLAPAADRVVAELEALLQQVELIAGSDKKTEGPKPKA
jgi:four helix bundle protein